MDSTGWRRRRRKTPTRLRQYLGERSVNNANIWGTERGLDIVRSERRAKKTQKVLNFVLITRNSSADEIANVNCFYDDVVHALRNTIDSCINSGTDRRGYVLEHRFTKFSEITQFKGHYAVQGHSKSPILVPIESSYIPISD